MVSKKTIGEIMEEKVNCEPEFKVNKERISKLKLTCRAIREYCRENKKLVRRVAIGTGVAIGIGSYVALGPCGGWNAAVKKYKDINNYLAGTYQASQAKETKLGKTIEDAVKEKMKKDETIRNLSRTANMLIKNEKARTKADASFNQQYFYDTYIDADKSGSKIQTARLDETIPRNSEYNDKFYKQYKRNLDASTYLINDDLKAVLGKKYDDIYNAVENDINTGIILRGNKLRLVRWQKYDTIYNTIKSLDPTKEELGAIRSKVEQYRKGCDSE